MGGSGSNGLNCLVLENNIEVPVSFLVKKAYKNASCSIADSPLYTILYRIGYTFLMKMLMIFCLRK